MSSMETSLFGQSYSKYFLYSLLVLCYAWLYAPYGINETDGGFLTGLAWQVLSGKVLYQDIIYVRPPLPVWSRVAELQLLPENWGILGERCIFYLKTALYCWWGAALLCKNEPGEPNNAHPLLSAVRVAQLPLAVLGFMVSVHNYPPMAWHTVDGIFWAVLSVYAAVFGSKNAKTAQAGVFIAGILLTAALCCKQSFYPLVVLPVVLPFTHLRHRLLYAGGSLLTVVLFYLWLQQNSILENYFAMTNGAADKGQALQHGILDYFRIKPALLAISLPVLSGVGIALWRTHITHRLAAIAFSAWVIWLLALPATYIFSIYNAQDTVPPFAQARLLFWVAAGYLLLMAITDWQKSPKRITFLGASTRILTALLLISWCSAISWGYNLPILFAIPGIYAVLAISQLLFQKNKTALSNSSVWTKIYSWAYKNGQMIAIVGCFFVFFYGYQFIYRDGRRGEMKWHLGAIFPKLTGIYSDSITAERYRELKELVAQHGPVFATLPSFTQSHYLTSTVPPLPLDWVVLREIGPFRLNLQDAAKKIRPVYIVEKSFRKKLQEHDPQLYFVREIMEAGTIQAETTHFFLIDN
jgi:hypothetical protein